VLQPEEIIIIPVTDALQTKSFRCIQSVSYFTQGETQCKFQRRPSVHKTVPSSAAMATQSDKIAEMFYEQDEDVYATRLEAVCVSLYY